MARKPTVRPTPAELEILGVLWDRGPATVRQVHEALGDDKGTGYTTTLKLMQNMTDKGLLRRDESNRSHVYQSVAVQESTQRTLVQDMVTRVFGGSAAKLVLHALSSGVITRKEIAEIRKLLDGRGR